MSDKLHKLFELQRELNIRCGVDVDKIPLSDALVSHWILQYTRAIEHENTELADCCPWKWWSKYQTLDRQNAKVEMIDLLHFVFSVAQVLGMTADDVFDAYVQKHKVNQQRQDEGYTEKKDDCRHIGEDDKTRNNWMDRRLGQIGIDVRQPKEEVRMRYYLILLQEEIRMTRDFLEADGCGFKKFKVSTPDADEYREAVFTVGRDNIVTAVDVPNIARWAVGKKWSGDVNLSMFSIWKLRSTKANDNVYPATEEL